MRSLFFFVIQLLFISTITAQSLQTATDKNGFTYQFAENDPLQARIYTLRNGLKIFLSQYKDAPRIQTYIAVKAGSKNDPSNTTGLAHYLEHILFKGTDSIGTVNWEAEKKELDKIEALYEIYRNTTDSSKRVLLYQKIDSISLIAASYAIANEYDKLLGNIGAIGTNAYTFVEQTVYVNDIPSNQIEKWAMIEAERFRIVVPRLFHTELEAVYEEKNKGMDQDRRKVWEETMASLFKVHTYGTQTTIGTIEHLKNPSITEIKKYFNTYYVANNMAVCMSGDFDYDSTIAILSNHFGQWRTGIIPTYKSPIEAKITTPIRKTVIGPDAESLSITYRIDASLTQNPEIRIYLKALQMLLSNGQAGLIDLNVNQAQKGMGGYAYDLPLKDYSIFMLGAKPVAGQSIEDLEAVLLEQISNIKSGRFDDWLLPAVINDYKKSMLLSYENNRNRADAFVDAFIWDIPWNIFIQDETTLSKFTKSDLQLFTTKYFNQNYVTIFKSKGIDTTITKVPKPKISAVPVNRDNQSAFYAKIENRNSPIIQPVFFNPESVTKSVTGKLPLLYKQNTTNDFFFLQYKWDIGVKYDPAYKVLVTYLDYLGTKNYSGEEFKKAFYKIGCDYSIAISGDKFTISISGLKENMPKALELIEDFILNVQGDVVALEQVKSNILKTRLDNKSSKDVILRSAMVNYAKYKGANPFNHILPEHILKTLQSNDILSYFHRIKTTPHKVVYYGPNKLDDVAKTIAKYHKIKVGTHSLTKEQFSYRQVHKNIVYFVPYEMVQAEVIILSPSVQYNKDLAPAQYLYNEYFGGNMGSLVFQELRESRALAYSVKSVFESPSRPGEIYFSNSYIGTQADKLNEALKGLLELIDSMPASPMLFENSKQSILETIRSTRVTKAATLSEYERMELFQLSVDPRKTIYENIPSMSFNDLKTFQETYIKGKHRVILVIGSKSKIDMSVLQQFGEVKELTLEDIFGY
jgi:predicted Zn-dependent peptidase